MILWPRFKELVKELREQQRHLMNEQAGGNQIMIALHIWDGDDHSITFVPHAIDLRSGRVFTRAYGKYQHINIKKIMENWK